MPFNDAHIQLGTAIPPVEQVSTRKGRTFLADIQTENERTRAYLKLLNIGDIAREALCATLARLLGLPIAQAYYVSVDPSYVGDQLIGNDQNIAFGLKQDPYYPTFQVRSGDLDRLVHEWTQSDALGCAVFDEWVFNSDRLPNNLIFDSTRVYWLIDHDETLPNGVLPGAPASSSLLRLLSSSKSEFELWKLRDKAMAWVRQYESIQWESVLELLRPNDLSGSETHYLRYIEFLKNRVPAMHDIITTSIGIQQRHFDLENRRGPIDRFKEET